MIRAKVTMEFDEDSELEPPYGKMGTFIECEPEEFEQAMINGARAIARMRRGVIEGRKRAEYEGGGHGSQ